jgi:hypothetical protein
MIFATFVLSILDSIYRVGVDSVIEVSERVALFMFTLKVNRGRIMLNGE